MDPIAKLKAKFNPPTMLRRPLAAGPSSIKDHSGAESPAKRPRLLSTPTTYTLQEGHLDEAGPSQPAAQAVVLSRSKPTAAGRSSSANRLAAEVGTKDPIRSTSGTDPHVYPAAASTEAVDGPYYLCTWRKPQFKKHKTWDGDAVLVVKNDGKHCALKCTETGKDLCSRAAFNYEQLSSGDQLTIAGKEIEIDREITRQEYLRGPAANAVPVAKPTMATRVSNPFKAVGRSSSAARTTARTLVKDEQVNIDQLGPANASTFYAKAAEGPVERRSPVRASGLTNPGQGKVPHARFDPEAEGAIVMKRPDASHQRRFNKKDLPVVDVVVDPHLSKALRPHQVEGVKFMYERVMGMHANGEKGQGVILADEMGLGKTLQTIALILTLMKQSCYYTPASCTIERALIVCPLSLVKNWKREFRKWIGHNALNVLCIDDGKGKEDVERFVRSKTYQVLVIGYEKLRTCVSTLKEAQPPVGLIVCDEGHRLKSRDAKTTKMFQELKTKRRIILSGTPIQNDLSEFYAMIDFVAPGFLEDYSKFKSIFEDPIIKSRAPHCSKEVRELGQLRSSSLVKVTKDIILRRTADLLAQYLKPKHEIVLFCSPSALQLDIYRTILNSNAVRSVLRGEAGNGLIQIGILRKLCNSPELLLKDLEGTNDSATKIALGDALKHFPGHRRRYEASYSGKMACVVELLRTIKVSTNDRVVLVSNFTSTLDIMEGVLRKLRYKFVRLDGQTQQDERMNIVSNLNCEDSSTFVFLLSAKSGGVGLNLIGANRLILFDSDWNPSTDQQAMARIHRDGQKKPCFIYRMLLSGTMDEKIYQRQLSKLALSDSLINNTGGNGSSKRSSDAFSQEELLDIFTLHTNTTCLCHRQLGCDCGGKGSMGKTARRARIKAVRQLASVTNSEPGSDPPLGDGAGEREDDDDDDDDDDDEERALPGFVAASQHIATAVKASGKERRAKLAALYDWAHFDCYLRPDSFQVDPVIVDLLRSYEPPAQTARQPPPPASDSAVAESREIRVKLEGEASRLSGPATVTTKGRTGLLEQLDQADHAGPEGAAVTPTVNSEGTSPVAARSELGDDWDEDPTQFNVANTEPGRILFAFAKSSTSAAPQEDELENQLASD